MVENKFQGIINGKDKEIRAINKRINFKELDDILYKKRNLLYRWNADTVDLSKIPKKTQQAFKNYLTSIIAAVETRISELKSNISEGNNKQVKKGDMLKRMGNSTRGAGRIFTSKLGNKDPKHLKL